MEIRNRHISWLVTGMGLVVMMAPLESIAVAAETPEDTLAAAIDIYVYPAEGQDKAQQSEDDYECYRWARSRTGFDPLNPGPRPQVAESSIESRSGKDAAKDVAAGAAVGAVIGEIGRDDAGEGAAIGGFLGAIRAYKKNKAYKDRQRRHAQMEIDAEIEQDRLKFKNAFSACLSARGYSVR